MKRTLVLPIALAAVALMAMPGSAEDIEIPPPPPMPPPRPEIDPISRAAQQVERPEPVLPTKDFSMTREAQRRVRQRAKLEAKLSRRRIP